jgi:hypothetical protein
MLTWLRARKRASKNSRPGYSNAPQPSKETPKLSGPGYSNANTPWMGSDHNAMISNFTTPQAFVPQQYSHRSQQQPHSMQRSEQPMRSNQIAPNTQHSSPPQHPNQSSQTSNSVHRHPTVLTVGGKGRSLQTSSTPQSSRQRSGETLAKARWLGLVGNSTQASQSPTSPAAPVSKEYIPYRNNPLHRQFFGQLRP